MTSELKRDLLIEIGTEELPPKSLSRMMRLFGSGIEKKLKEAQFTFRSVKSFSTPRRLAVLVEQLISAQPDRIEERRGPSIKAAYGDDGTPTKAAMGFMRSCGVDDIELLDQLETDKGAWLVYKEHKPGAQLKDLISDIIQQSLADLPVDRNMRWGANRTEFIRPVHWLVVLFGDEVLPATVLGIGANNISYGHRFMSTGPVHLINPGEYVETLRKSYVIVDFEARKSLIFDQLAAVATGENAEVVIDEDLLDEVTSLVEWPVALSGNFNSDFLSVPEEALISAMKSHQRYFHMIDKQGHLLPKFITVANIESTDPQVVITGNERVIAPRLSDADFFFNQDKKTSLDEKLARLKQVVFHSKLGSYHDKATRISRLSGYIARSLDADTAAAERAGLLCKSDLVSDMVNEFPDLQGLMGGYYARHDGEPDSVSEAISEHYKPTASGSDLPVSLVSQCVAIADKADTICGLFAAGQPPSGSRDPFALRRQTLGIIRICIDHSLPINLKDLFKQSIDLYDLDFDEGEILSYLLERLGIWYQETGIDFDTFNAVRESNVPISILTEADSRIRSLQDFRRHPKAVNLIAANKRLANILRKADTSKLPDVDVAMFHESAESSLIKAIEAASKTLDGTITNEEKFLALADLQPDIDRYFDDVMVMADDVALRNNRLATLLKMRSLFLSIADLSVLQ